MKQSQSQKRAAEHKCCDTVMRKNGPHWGLYCAQHNTWIRWLNAAQVNQMETTRPRPDAKFLMPWGQYRGQPIAQVPEQYLKWAADNTQDTGLATQIRAELAWRDWN